MRAHPYQNHGSHWIRPERRRAIYHRDRWRCFWCGFRPFGYMRVQIRRHLTLDHIIPRCRGGGNESSNLVTSCRLCNNRRGSRSALEFMAYLGIGVDALPEL